MAMNVFVQELIYTGWNTWYISFKKPRTQIPELSNNLLLRYEKQKSNTDHYGWLGTG